MNKYRSGHLIRPGFIGIVLIVLIVAVGLQPERLLSMATTVRYQALFSQAGGLRSGDDVTVSGIKVGTVSDVSLKGGDALVTFVVDGKILLGSATTAHIQTGSLLGQRVLDVESEGSGRLRPMDVIPTPRTSSPYSLTEATGELTTDSAGTDTESLNQSLETLSQTINQIAPQLRPAFDGLTRLSQILNSRDQTLDDLLEHASKVTGILSERSQQVNSLILKANDLLAVLVQRRQAIVDLLANTSAVAKQLTALVHDNEKTLGPTLDKLNAVTAVLQKNRDNIALTLPRLARYQITLGEDVASGFYYQAFVPNLLISEFFQPFIDYLWGFRTFDTAPGRGLGLPSPTPRALFPWPYNGIPGGSR
jgi:phospholipid/cholesterol/gamma-HCH transport system substrate-binding protein